MIASGEFQNMLNKKAVITTESDWLISKKMQITYYEASLPGVNTLKRPNAHGYLGAESPS